MSVVILFLTFLIANTIAAMVPHANASSQSPYRSGYNHGCDDADISDPDDRYINQPEKGPSFHTNEFMRGYNDGYDACSNTNSSTPSNQGNGLRIIVDFRFDAGKLCLYEFEDPVGTSIDCSEPDGPGEITFETNQIDVGERFKVCEESEYPRFIHCETGENGPENEPEHLYFN